MAAAEPSSSPVPIEPPTATMAIWPALSWWQSPLSCLLETFSWLVETFRGIADVYQKALISQTVIPLMTFVIAMVRSVIARSSNLLLDFLWVTPRGAGSHGRNCQANGSV